VRAAEGRRSRGFFAFYVRALRRVPGGRGWGLVLFLLSSLMHALGHAALALAAGRCAALLVGAWAANGGSAMNSAVFPLQSALLVAGVGLLAALLKGIGGVGAAYGQARIAGSAGAALRVEVLDRLLSVHQLRRARQGDHGVTVPHPGQPTDGPSAARRVTALTACIREVEHGLHTGVLGGLRAGAQLLPLLAILFWLAPTLALAALAVFAPFAVVLGMVRRGWKRAHAEALRHNEHMLEAADEAVRHADLWMSYGAERKARDNVDSLGEIIARASARLEATAAAMTGANEVLGALALIGALAAARAGWLGHAADGAKMLGFTVAFFLAYRPIRDLTEARLAWARGQAAFEEIEDLAPPTPASTVIGSATPVILSEAKDPTVPAGGMGAWGLGSLDIRGLVLPRGGAAPLDLTVAPGQIVAVLGPTGAGKTTLLRTLLGLETPTAGDISYAGASLSGADRGPRARPFAWVPQDAPLLADTLAANVALGAPADAREALTPLGAAHLVDALGSSRLGQGGRAVSGGERQWIALARAIATRQPILLLDEPTSGLDAESQTLVLDAIARLRGERTVLLVTHRPEPLAIADRVVRMGS
jgi:ABC-type multidrug transport system fused ATPase/permease subunit